MQPAILLNNYITMSITTSELLAGLSDGWFTITFNKVDGTVRTMICTTNPFLIPDEHLPKEAPSKEQTYSTEQIRVYERDIGWRSFRKSSVIGIVPTP